MLQNFTLFTSDQTKKKYPNFSKRMAAVSGGARDARVSFSCFKLLKDITLLNDIYKNYKPTPKTSSALALFDAGLIGSHFIYAIFENSTFYNRIGATKKDRSDTYGKLFSFFWTVYIVIAVNKKLYELKHFVPSKDQENDKLRKKIIYLEMFSNACDIFNAFGGSGIPKALVGRDFSNSLKGLGCTVAAGTALYAYKLSEKVKPQV